ncbi:MATE family efflux transporter [Aliikangiella coralliicola]|uniref:Multidrug-efflux transporter n=1 Tax=Aliikangiella coralliicola TaxID=2592383 RepID=A0A545U4S7_9GAMM|nr:MATE family efflux transporter [Aliikangiella coralliicola]TQV84444.1 MATE family efflux transporter [Aliikangiella coralliicola]
MFNKISQETKYLLPIAIPAVLSQLAQMAMGVIDTVMAGHYSNDALAAIAIGTSLLHPVLIFFMGLFLAFNPIIAHFRGADSQTKIGMHFRLGIILAAAFSPIAILVLLNAQYVLHLLGVAPEVAELATGYLHATVWGMPGLLIFLALRFCNEGMFSTPAIMASTVFSIPFNIGFNYWFMYGGYGVPEMGAIGVGYATSLVWTMMCLGLLLYTIFTPKYASLEIFKHTSLPHWVEIKEVLRLGLPMAVTLGFEITMFAAVSLMIARYPTEVMGAHQIAVNIASISFMIPLGISQAITARVGYFAGKKDPTATQLAGYTGIGLSAAISGFSASTMILLPFVLVGFYTIDNQILEIAASLLFYAAIFQFSDALQVSSAGALRGVKDTKIPMFITAISYWLVGFPVGYILAENFGYQASGYWIGLIAGLSTAAVLLLHRWVMLSAKKPGEMVVV